MSKKLLHFNEQGYNDSMRILGDFIEPLQRLIDEYHSLNVGRLQHDDLFKMVRNPKCFVFDKLTGGTLKIGDGLTMKKEKAIEMIDYPDGFEKFVENLKKLFSWFDDMRVPVVNVPVSKDNFTEFFTLNEEGKIGLSNKVEDRIRQSCCLYAVSDAAKAVYTFAEMIVDYVNNNDIKRAGGGSGKIEELIKGLIDSGSSQDAPVCIHYHNLAHFNESRYKAPKS